MQTGKQNQGDEPEDIYYPELSLQQNLYLAHFALHCHHGLAAKEACVTPRTAHRWRSKEDFLKRFEETKVMAVQALHDRGVREVTHGTFNPSVWTKLMEAHDPAFRQKREIQHSGEVAMTGGMIQFDAEFTPRPSQEEPDE